MTDVATSTKALTTQDRLRQLDMDGFCVVEGVIPADVVDEVRDSVVAAQARHSGESEKRLAATRARGHRIGVPGVAPLKQVINRTQTFAPYLAECRIMEVIEGLFGPFARISCTDVVINNPGCGRGYWHADWPYNQTNASNIPAPYCDAPMHLSTIWMLTDFRPDNGATLIVPGSHREPDNPAAGELEGVDQDAPYPTEIHALGKAGSVYIADSRTWHAVAPNNSDEPRVGMIIRYAPWWLNLNPSMIGSPEHSMMVVETGGKNYESEPLRREVFESLPEEVKPLYRHCVGD